MPLPGARHEDGPETGGYAAELPAIGQAYHKVFLRISRFRYPQTSARFIARNPECLPHTPPENTESGSRSKAHPPYPSRNEDHSGVEKQERHESVDDDCDPTAPPAMGLRVPPNPDHVGTPNSREDVVTVKARSRGYSKQFGGLSCGLFVSSFVTPMVAEVERRAYVSKIQEEAACQGHPGSTMFPHEPCG